MSELSDSGQTPPTSSQHPMAAGRRRPSGNNPYKCPGRVQVAGALVAGYGVLLCVGTILNIFLQARRPDDPTLFDLCGCLFGAALGVASLSTGLATLRGAIRDVLIPSVVTLMVAASYTTSGFYFLGKADNAPAYTTFSREAFLAAGFVYLAFAGLSFVTALLALSARGRYRRWATVEAGDTTVVLRAAAPDVEEYFPGVVCPECEKASPLTIWQGGLWCRACTVWVVRPASPPAEPPDEKQPEGREQEPG